MKPEVAKKWIEALRSKKYKQGAHVLKKEMKSGVVRHCCLGVLCELYNQQKKKEQKTPLISKRATKEQLIGLRNYQPKNVKIYNFGGTKTVEAITELPYRVMRWAGMSSSDGRFGLPHQSWATLATINDKGYTFKQIADVIEKDIERL